MWYVSSAKVKDNYFAFRFWVSNYSTEEIEKCCRVFAERVMSRFFVVGTKYEIIETVQEKNFGLLNTFKIDHIPMTEWEFYEYPMTTYELERKIYDAFNSSDGRCNIVRKLSEQFKIGSVFGSGKIQLIQLKELSQPEIAKRIFQCVEKVNYIRWTKNGSIAWIQV